jgi:hypothetical protein
MGRRTKDQFGERMAILEEWEQACEKRRSTGPFSAPLLSLSLACVTMPKCKPKGQQTPTFFGQKYSERFNSSTTGVLEPSTKKRRRQRTYRRPSEIYGFFASDICPCLFDGSTLQRGWLLTTLAKKHCTSSTFTMIMRPSLI